MFIPRRPLPSCPRHRLQDLPGRPAGRVHCLRGGSERPSHGGWQATTAVVDDERLLLPTSPPSGDTAGIAGRSLLTVTGMPPDQADSPCAPHHCDPHAHRVVGDGDSGPRGPWGGIGRSSSSTRRRSGPRGGRLLAGKTERGGYGVQRCTTAKLCGDHQLRCATRGDLQPQPRDEGTMEAHVYSENSAKRIVPRVSAPSPTMPRTSISTPLSGGDPLSVIRHGGRRRIDRKPDGASASD